MRLRSVACRSRSSSHSPRLLLQCGGTLLPVSWCCSLSFCLLYLLLQSPKERGCFSYALVFRVFLPISWNSEMLIFFCGLDSETVVSLLMLSQLWPVAGPPWKQLLSSVSSVTCLPPCPLECFPLPDITACRRLSSAVHLCKLSV